MKMGVVSLFFTEGREGRPNEILSYVIFFKIRQIIGNSFFCNFFQIFSNIVNQTVIFNMGAKPPSTFNVNKMSIYRY